MAIGDIAMFGSAILMLLFGLTRLDARVSFVASVGLSIILLYFVRVELAIGSAAGGRTAFNMSVVLFVVAFTVGLFVIYYVGRFIRNVVS